MTQSYKVGVVAAFVATLIMVVSNIVSRYAAVKLGAYPPLFAAFTTLIAAFVLLIIAGPGRGGLETLRSPHTWFYGILQILFFISETYAYRASTVIETTTLLRMSIVFTVLLAWVILDRRPRTHDMAGSLFIVIALGYMMFQLPAESRALTIVAIFLGSLFLTLRTIAAETHPSSNKAFTVRDQSRVTGIVLVVTATIFIFVFMLLGAALDSNAVPQNIAILPSVSHFRNPHALVLGFVSGALLVSSSSFLYFYATKTIGTENWMSIVTSAILMTVVMESIVAWLGLLEVNSVDWKDLVVAMLVSGIAFWMVLKRRMG